VLIFSSCGRYLATHARLPDSRLRVWHWSSNAVVAEADSPNREEHSIAFSKVDFKRIVTCGPEHLTFWNLIPASEEANKGRLTYSRGHYGLRAPGVFTSAADSGDGSGRLVSSATASSLLLWTDEATVAEVVRKNGSGCHEGEISQLVAEEGELISIGIISRDYKRGRVCVYFPSSQAPTDGLECGTWPPSFASPLTGPSRHRLLPPLPWRAAPTPDKGRKRGRTISAALFSGRIP